MCAVFESVAVSELSTNVLSNPGVGRESVETGVSEDPPHDIKNTVAITKTVFFIYFTFCLFKNKLRILPTQIILHCNSNNLPFQCAYSFFGL